MVDQEAQMGQEQLHELAEKLMDDPQLRALFLENPQQAAQKAGVQLEPEDMEALDNLNVHEMDDSELVARISKRGPSIS
jgi:hypothetical protein